MQLKKTVYCIVILVTLFLTACKEPPVEKKPKSPPFLSVDGEQVMSMNQILLDEVFIPENSWATIHVDSGKGEPVLSESLGFAKFLKAGTHQEESLVVLDSALTFSSGDQVWVILHEDGGEDKEYEYNTSGGKQDKPLELESGELLAERVTIIAPTLVAADQSLRNNRVVVDSLFVGTEAWVVVHLKHPRNSSFYNLPAEAAVKVDAGAMTNLEISLDSNEVYPSGTQLYIVLCKNESTNEKWDPYDDFPESFGYQDIFVKVEILP